MAAPASIKRLGKAALRRAIGTALANAPTPDPRQTSRDYYLALHELYQRHVQARASAPDDDLTPAELRVSSQNGEDGVLVEILRRVGTSASPYFVEFGAETGSEGNCVFLADVLGWAGLFIEANSMLYPRLAGKYELNHRVQTIDRFVTATSVEAIFQAAGVPSEFDVLSIDVDGQDWWIWRAITCYRPKVVAIEYNAELSGEGLLVEPEEYENPVEGLTTYFGASIAAFRALGDAKGYRLVHTELTGANAFFVRADLSGAWAEPDRVQLRGLNYRLHARGHPPDVLGRNYVDVTHCLPRREAGHGTEGLPGRVARTANDSVDALGRSAATTGNVLNGNDGTRARDLRRDETTS